MTTETGAPLANGFYEVPAGKIAMVVTHLEMRAPSGSRPVLDPKGITLRLVQAPDAVWYRDLLTRVGGLDWLWFSRLILDDTALEAILNEHDREVWVVEKDGQSEGLLELDFSSPGECELAFFGLTSELIGSGIGRWLMNHAIEQAFARPIERFHLHTCTLDHPGALEFYRRSGFTPTRRQVEIADDPRVSGVLPETAAPQVPILR